MPIGGALRIVVCVGCLPVLALAGGSLEVSHKFRMKGEYPKAEAALREGLQTETDQLERSLIMSTLADLLREENRCTEARAYFEEALREGSGLWQARFGALMGLADLDRQDEAWESSLAQWNEALQLGVTHRSTIFESLALRGLGETWMDRGDLARAEPLLKRSLSLVENTPNAPEFRVGMSVDTLARLYRLQGKTGMAEELWTRELQIDRKVFGDDHPQTAMVMGRLAEVWSLNGELDRAREYARQVADIMRRHFDEGSPAMASALVSEGVVEQRAHQPEKAAKLYGAAFQIMQATGAPPNVSQVVTQLYAGVLSQLHRGREAKQVRAEGLAFRSK